MKWYLEVLKKSVVFSGRARRKEYWMFVLFCILIGLLLEFLDGLTGISGGGNTSMVGLVFQLAMFLPGTAVGIRGLGSLEDGPRIHWSAMFSSQDLAGYEERANG